MKPVWIVFFICYFLGFATAWLGLGLLIISRDLRKNLGTDLKSVPKMGGAPCLKK